MVASLIVVALLAQSSLPPAPPRPVYKGNSPGAMPPIGPPLPPGQQITVQDGDTVVINNTDRIRLIRRVSGNVRVTYSADAHRIIVLADETSSNGGPDGFVDERWVFSNVTGNWPLADRWDGSATIDEYFPVDRTTTSAGFGLTTPAGLIQFFQQAGFRTQVFEDGSAAGVIRFSGGSHGTMDNRLGFDAAEQDVIASQERSVLVAAPRAQTSRPVATAATPGPMPVRVGGTITAPTKIVDAKPVYPSEAMAAHIQGVVVIEATIGADGAVQNAKVLRSIPMLDAAALAAVRQWRYTPTLMNGQPVPVVMTVTVDFAVRD